jgi:uncharacterized protein
VTRKPTSEEKELRQFKVPNIELRKADGEAEPTKIVGYAVEWDKLSDPIWGYFQEQFRKGAFTKSLKNGDQRALWQHLTHQPLGRTTSGTLTLEEDDTGLRYEILPPDTSWGKDAVESIKRGDVTNSSFLFRGVVTEWDDSNPDMSIRTVVEAELYEVSPVTFPAYPQSSVGVRSAQEVYESHAAEKAANDKPNQPDYSLRRKKLDLVSKL